MTGMNGGCRILVIEDDSLIADLVQLHLRDIGCKVDVEANGRSGLSAFRGRPYDLMVLDLTLPDMDGLAVCRELRSEPGYVPILMLTARTSEMDRVLGLELGADDYLTKPFSIPELQARVKALMRRVSALADIQQQEEVQEVIRCNDLCLEVEKRRVTLGGSEVLLTAKEFELLLYFVRHPGRVYSRTQLLDSVWGYQHESFEHTVNSHINRLRTKIERDPAHPRYILTVWGVGYKFADG